MKFKLKASAQDWIIFGIFAFIGVIIGAFGSIISLNKYLKEHNSVVETE